jgi:anti-anti-sigma factor
MSSVFQSPTVSSLHPPNPVQPFDDGLSEGGPDRFEPFELRIEPIGDGWIQVSVGGELAVSSADELERAVEHELLAGRHVLLDLSRIAFIDSFGLRAMTGLVRIAKGNSRELKLSSDLPEHARRLMEIVGLLPFVPIGGAEPEPEPEPADA